MIATLDASPLPQSGNGAAGVSLTEPSSTPAALVSRPGKCYEMLMGADLRVRLVLQADEFRRLWLTWRDRRSPGDQLDHRVAEKLEVAANRYPDPLPADPAYAQAKRSLAAITDDPTRRQNLLEDANEAEHPN